MKLRAKPIAAGTAFIAAALFVYYPNPLWTTGRLIGELSSGNEMHRLLAVELVKDRASGSDSVVPALVLSLGDSWNEVRGAASAALCGIGAPAGPYVKRALQNEDPNIQDMAYTTMECLKLKGIK